MSAPADAARVTWVIDGTVPNVSDELNSLGLLDGASYRYELTYESSTPPLESLNSCCTFTFNDAVLAVSFTSGAFAVALPPGETRKFINVYHNIVVEGPVELRLYDAHPTTGPKLPIAPPLFLGTYIGLEWGQYGTGPYFQFFPPPNQMSYRVPEPGVALLALAGFLALAAAKR